MKVNTKVKVDMAPVQQVMKRLGVTPDGEVQAFVTNMVNHRITRYMPFRSSVLATKAKIPGTEHLEDQKRITGPTEITVFGSYAHFQYEGKVWIYPPTGSTWTPKYGMKEKTDRNLTYDKSKNPEAGSHWDRHLMAAEGAAMAEAVQTFVNRRKRPK